MLLAALLMNKVNLTIYFCSPAQLMFIVASHCLSLLTVKAAVVKEDNYTGCCLKYLTGARSFSWKREVQCQGEYLFLHTSCTFVSYMIFLILASFFFPISQNIFEVIDINFSHGIKYKVILYFVMFLHQSILTLSAEVG